MRNKLIQTLLVLTIFVTGCRKESVQSQAGTVTDSAATLQQMDERDSDVSTSEQPSLSDTIMFENQTRDTADYEFSIFADIEVRLKRTTDDNDSHTIVSIIDRKSKESQEYLAKYDIECWSPFTYLKAGSNKILISELEEEDYSITCTAFCQKDTALYKLGTFYITQPNAEIEGIKKHHIEAYQVGDSLFITTLLDNKKLDTYRYSIKDAIPAKPL